PAPRPGPATGGRPLYAPPAEIPIRRANHAQSVARLTTRHIHRMMVADARTAAEIPDVAGCLQQKSDYVGAAGWTPEFVGADAAWGSSASTALAEADQICCARGPLCDFDRIIDLAGQYLDHSGEFFVYLGETGTGFP